MDETNRTLNDFDAAKKKLSIENSDLLRQLEEAESQVSQLSKIKISLTTQLEDTKRLADEEGRVSQQTIIKEADQPLPIVCIRCKKDLTDEPVYCRNCQKRNFENELKLTASEEEEKKTYKVDVKPVANLDAPQLPELKRKTSTPGTKKEYYSVLPGMKFQ